MTSLHVKAGNSQIFVLKLLQMFFQDFRIFFLKAKMMDTFAICTLLFIAQTFSTKTKACLILFVLDGEINCD